MSRLKMLCWCGKMIDDPTHKETHTDNFLSESQAARLSSDVNIVRAKFRSDKDLPWKQVFSKRIGNTFHMIGIYQP